MDVTVPAVTDSPAGVGAMWEDGAHAWFTRVAAQRAPNWRNELLLSGLVEGAVFRPLDHLDQARVPLLLVVAPDDRLNPPLAALPVAADHPAISVTEVSGNHFDAYEAGFDVTCGAAIDWFAAHLSH